MPVCRNCGNRIDKFNKDICPICGCKNPLEGVVSDTVEVTSQIDANSADFKNYKPKLRVITFVLFILVGWTGGGFFYLGHKKIGLIWLLCNIAVLGGIGSLLAFATPLGASLGYLTVASVVYLINIGVGIYYLCKRDIKDALGEFIQ